MTCHQQISPLELGYGSQRGSTNIPCLKPIVTLYCLESVAQPKYIVDYIVDMLVELGNTLCDHCPLGLM